MRWEVKHSTTSRLVNGTVQVRVLVHYEYRGGRVPGTSRSNVIIIMLGAQFSRLVTVFEFSILGVKPPSLFIIMVSTLVAFLPPNGESFYGSQE